MGAAAAATTTAILRAIPRLRPLPAVARHVLQLVQDPEYSIDELIAVVRTDPALVARLLRLCNSAGSGLHREVGAIGDALSFLGSRHLVQLVLATCSAATFAQAGAGRFADPIALWRHSVATAVAGQRLLRDHGATTQASAFTAGILHGVGGLVLDLIATPADLARAASLSPAAATDDLAREQAAFDLDHGVVGGFVAAAWQLPDPLVFALRGHHEATMLSCDDPLPAALHIADHLAPVLLGNATNAHRIAPTALQRLDLDATALDAVTVDAKADLTTMEELLNLVAAASR